MIVPVFNGMKFIDIFLESLDKKNREIEVIFVDNGSDDNSYEHLKSFCRENVDCRIYRYKEKQSSYAARNYGVSKSNRSIFLFTDIDCVLTKDYFQSISKITLNEDSLISGPTNIFLEKYNIYEYFDQCTYLTQESYSKRDYAATANLIVGRRLYEKVGGFPEFTSGADNKFCNMCVKKGGNLDFCNDLIVMHPPRANLKEHLIKAKRLGIGHGETYTDQKKSFVAIFSVITLQIFLLFLPIHSARLFIRVFQKRRWGVINIFSLFRLCFLVVGIQRIYILKTLLKKLMEIK